MDFIERSLQFRCRAAALYGILSVPEQPLPQGVLIVVGGPQYRAGSHRQFVLLARHLAATGIPVMRFDYRGMGDSEGDRHGFEQVHEDIHAALDQFAAEVPAVREIVIFGLCDAACAALFYAHQDPRICGLVLANPWVRTEEGLAKTYLKHYYLDRLRDRALWQKILGGRFEYRMAAHSFFRMLITALSRRIDHASPTQGIADDNRPLPERMLEGLQRFQGHVLFVLSGNDLTAQEFINLVNGSEEWQKRLDSPMIERRTLPEANHTFSRRDWRDQVASWISDWVRSF